MCIRDRLGKLPVGVAREFGGGCFGDVDHCPRLAGKYLGQRFGAGGNHQVTADDGVGFAGGDARGMDIFGLVSDAQVRKDGAEFLRQAGHVEYRDALAVEVRGHAEQGAEGDDAGPANAGDQDVEGASRVGQHGVGKVGKSGGKSGRKSALIGGDGAAGAQFAAFDGDKAGAEAIDARKILVARRLIDRSFAAELGFEWNHRQAVRLHATVAASFTNRLVDEHSPGRIDEMCIRDRGNSSLRTL